MSCGFPAAILRQNHDLDDPCRHRTAAQEAFTLPAGRSSVSAIDSSARRSGLHALSHPGRRRFDDRPGYEVGRGYRYEKGDIAGSEADVAAAQAVNPDVADAMALIGLK
jgi:hypothetical protein